MPLAEKRVPNWKKLKFIFKTTRKQTVDWQNEVQNKVQEMKVDNFINEFYQAKYEWLVRKKLITLLFHLQRVKKNYMMEQIDF